MYFKNSNTSYSPRAKFTRALVQQNRRNSTVEKVCLSQIFECRKIICKTLKISPIHFHIMGAAQKMAMTKVQWASSKFKNLLQNIFLNPSAKGEQAPNKHIAED